MNRIAGIIFIFACQVSAQTYHNDTLLNQSEKDQCLFEDFFNKTPVESAQVLEIQVEDSTIMADALAYVWKSVPNIEETVLEVFWQAPLDQALSDWTLQLGNNPTAKSIIRDTTKVPATYTKASMKTQIGGTKYFYDWGHVAGQCTKVVGKGATIYILIKFGQDPKAASWYANYVGETFARFFVNAGKAHQDSRSEVDVFSYSIKHFQPVWGITGAVEVVPKVFSSDCIGWLFGVKLGIGESVRRAMMGAINTVFPWTLNPSISFYTNARLFANKDVSYAKAASIYSSIFLLRCGVAITENLVISYVMSPPTRIVTDVAGDLYKGYFHPFLESYIHPFLKKHIDEKSQS